MTEIIESTWEDLWAVTANEIAVHANPLEYSDLQEYYHSLQSKIYVLKNDDLVIGHAIETHYANTPLWTWIHNVTVDPTWQTQVHRDAMYQCLLRFFRNNAHYDKPGVMIAIEHPNPKLQEMAMKAGYQFKQTTNTGLGPDHYEHQYLYTLPEGAALEKFLKEQFSLPLR